MIKAIAFDFDGTVMDTSSGIFETARHTAKALGWDKELISPIEKFVGPPLYDCFRIVFGWDREMCEKAVSIYRPYYREKGMFKGTFYPGMLETLTRLRERGYKTAIATMKFDALIHEMGQHFGFTSYFDVIKGTDSTSKMTKAQILGFIASELGVKPEEMVLVGDTMVDYEGAREAGMPFIGALYGFGLDDDEISSLDKGTCMALIESPADLLNQVKRSE
ncbi:MAG: HAD hydrolase-like protein [Sphaerochaetaceae bacterium]|jgi:phosphoglycolate phosphatase|nr:HAD hydrolase-like protein [Sphaerochaetaceae bacterium]